MRWMIIVAILMMQCGYEFPTGYETIENDKVRSVVMVCNNDQLAEGAPSDTVDLYAYFGGEKIDSIRWSYSYGAGDTFTLDNIILPGSYKEYTSENTDSVSMSLVIPDSFIRVALAGVENVEALVPPFLRSSFPSGLLQKKPGEVLDILDFLSTQPSQGAIFADSLMRLLSEDEKMEAKELVPRVLQIFSVPLNIFVLINGKYKAKSNITIRYNSRLRYLGTYIPVNRNPQIKNVRLYQVRGERKTFNFAENSSEVVAYYDLKGLDSIPYQKGCSYFLQVFKESGLVDSGVTLQGIYDREHYTSEWFMQDNSYQGSGSDFLRIEKDLTTSLMVKIKMSTNPLGRSFTLWCVVYDYYLGERLRPVGFAIRCARVFFVAP
jgi:hypothetical protein